ncbi:MAG: hypothetical protein ACMUJM_25225 [bacterium]
MCNGRLGCSQNRPIPVIRSLVGTAVEQPSFIYGKRFLIIISAYKEYNGSISKYLTRAKEKNNNGVFMIMADEILDHIH